MASVHDDLTPLQKRVHAMIRTEIARSSQDELQKQLLAVTGGLAVQCIDSPHVDELLAHLGNAINTLDKIKKETKT